MAARARRMVLFTAPLLLLFVDVAGALPFSAEVVTHDTIAAAGHLEVTVGADYALRFSTLDASGPWSQELLRADATTFTIAEHRETPTPVLPPSGTGRASYHMEIIGPRDSAVRRESNATRLEMEEPAPTNTWGVRARAGPSAQGPPLVVADATCRLSAAANATSAVPEGNEDPKTSLPDPVDAVAARCEFGPVQVAGPMKVVLYGSTFRLVDGDGRNQLIRTGHYTEPSTAYPGLIDEVDATLVIETDAADANLTIPRAGRATLLTPALGIAGRLGFPDNASGVVRWGDAEIRNALDDVNPDGAFLVTAKDPELRILGDTRNGPVVRPAPGRLSVGIALSTAVAAVAGLGALLLGRRLGLGSVVAGLFTRLRRESVFDNESRRLVHEVVLNNPGIRAREAAKQLGLSHNAVLHHVGVLAAQGLVEIFPHGGAHGLFSAGQYSRERMLAQSLLRNPYMARLVATLGASPRLTQSDLARQIGASQTYVSKLLRALREAGFLEVADAAAGVRRYRVRGVLAGDGNPGALKAAF